MPNLVSVLVYFVLAVNMPTFVWMYSYSVFDIGPSYYNRRTGMLDA